MSQDQQDSDTSGEARKDGRFSDMRAWRETLGLNTYEAAKALGVSRTLIWELEKNGGAPKRTVQLAMQAISDAPRSSLDTRVSELEAEVAALKRLLLPVLSVPLPRPGYVIVKDDAADVIDAALQAEAR